MIMKYIILGCEKPDVDSIVSGILLEKVMKSKDYDATFMIPDKELDKDTIDVCDRYKINYSKYMVDKLDDDALYILVDHNKREVPGKIVGIIDHHKDLGTKAKYKNIVKASSTSLLIAKECEEFLDKKDMKLVCLATFIDTVSFHSSNVRKEDITYINHVCCKYDFEYDDFYREGLSFTNVYNVNEIIYNGLEKFSLKGYNIHSSYIQVKELSVIDDLIKKILKKLGRYVRKNKIDFYVFIVYDMSSFYTKVYKIYKDKVEESEYTLYASRSNTVIPDIVKKLESKDEKNEKESTKQTRN